MELDHIGYLVKKLPQAAQVFESLGYVRMGETTDDAGRGVEILFLKKDGYVVELVSPNRPGSVVEQLLKKYKNAPYHFCYRCGQLETQLQALQKQGFMLFGAPAPAPACGGRRVCFLTHPDMGMIELLEEKEEKDVRDVPLSRETL